MSKVFNMVGGGGGSLNPSDALIHVNAPLGSTVEFATGGVTVKTIDPSKAFANVDGTTADYYYPVKSANYGTWTVTATLTPDTASDTVVVSGAGQYDVKLLETVWIVRNGTANIDTDIYKVGSLTLTQESGFVLAKMTANSVGFVRSMQAIDMTNKSEVALELAMDSANRYGQSWYSSANIPVLGVSVGSVPPAVQGSETVTNIPYKTFLRTSTGADTTESTFTIDVSALTGVYTVCLTMGSSSALSGTYGYWNIYNFYVH